MLSGVAACATTAAEAGMANAAVMAAAMNIVVFRCMVILRGVDACVTADAQERSGATTNKTREPELCWNPPNAEQ
jgi:hypothetical protein